MTTTTTALRAFEHLGKRVGIRESDGTTLIGVLDSVTATRAADGPPEVVLVIGGHKVDVNGAWSLDVE